MPAVFAIVLMLQPALMFLVISRLGWLHGARERLLLTSIVWGVTLTLSTETLNLFRALTPIHVTIVWALACALTLALLMREGIPPRFDSIKFGIPPVSDVLLIVPTVCLIVLTLVIAVAAPPNTYDALNYHIPRVMHWIQGQSLAFYPTPILPQLHHPPMAEFAMLHIALIAGTDQFLNVVAWVSYCGSIIGASVIAQTLGGSRRAQILAALAGSTIPIAVLQASGAKNDVVLAHWTLCFAWLLLRTYQTWSVPRALMAGMALGLMLLTKGSGLLFAAPLLAIFGIASLAVQPRGWPRTIAAFTIIAVVGASLLMPHVSRNFALYRSPLGPPYDGPTPEFAHQTSAHSPAQLATAVLRSIAVQLGTSNGDANRELTRLVTAWHDWVGIALDDRGITWGNRTFYVVSAEPAQEEASPNPTHVVLIIGVSLAVLGSWSKLSPTTRIYVAALSLTFLLLATLLKWQPATTRFHLPLLFLWCPVLGLQLARVRFVVLCPITVVLLVGVYPAAFKNRWRPLLDAPSILQANRVSASIAPLQGRAPTHILAAEVVNARACQQVALVTGWADMEYPWWVLMPQVRQASGRLEHVAVRNVSAALPYPRSEPFIPCALISTDSAVPEEYEMDSRRFHPVWSENDLTVYLPAGEAPVTALRYLARYAGEVPTSWLPNETKSYAIAVTNAGSETWTTAVPYLLGVHFGTESNEPHAGWEMDRRFPLGRDVPPGETVTLDLEIRSPERQGPYVLRHRMFKEGSAWFSQIHKSDVVVVSAPSRRRR
ncbi:MAG: ArnT family glycosyltransferase [Chloroflexota bacterium]